MITDTREKILTHIREHQRVRAHELVGLLGISRVAIHKHLRRLLTRGAVQKTGTPPRVFYSLAGQSANGTTKDAGRAALNEVKTIIREEKPTLRKDFGVSKIGVFGSVVFGDAGKHSDVDVLVEFNRPVGLFTFVALENHLSERLGRTVDLVAKDGLKPYLRKEIVRSTVYV